MKAMISNFRKFLAFMLCLSLFLSSFPIASYGMPDLKDLTIKTPAVESPKAAPQLKITSRTAPPEVDSTASAWAVPEIKRAYEYGLTYPDIMHDYKKPITREEFCTIAVKLYEKLSNKAAPASKTIFTDTNNPEVAKANQLGIVKGTGGGKFSPNLQITRQEISVMVFRTLEAAIPELDKNSETGFDFVDRNEIAAWALDAMMYAYKHKILNGIGQGKIAPLMNTSREQAIAIIKRTYDSFSDSGSKTGNIAVQDNKGIDLGNIVVTPGKAEKDPVIKPGLSRTEGDAQVIVVPKTPGGSGIIILDPGARLEISSDIKNGLKKVPGTDKAIKIIDTTITVGSSKLSKAPTEEEKAGMTERINKLAYPNYDTRLTLTAAMGESKQSSYTAADGAVLIDQDGEKKQWFAFDLGRAPGVKNVVWQVSTVQFNGYKDNWKNPLGLVKSGQVSAQSGGFQIDFASFAPAKTNLHSYKIGAGGVLTWGGDKIYREIPTSRKTYYVRAVPVDATGNCVGDPGPGIAVLYGKPITDMSIRQLALTPSFEVWTTQSQRDPENMGEFLNLFEHANSRTMNCDSGSIYWFLFKGMDPEATQLVVQVGAKAFSDEAANWESPDGLVYTKTYKLPITEYYGGEWTNSLPVDFSLFAPSAASMKPGDCVQYYLRAVALLPSSGAGSLGVAFSETIPISYVKREPLKIYQQKTHYVKSYIPNIKILHYEPIKRENPDWHYYYMVYRAPKWNEINCDFMNQEGYVLKPYPYYLLHYTTLGLSKAPTIEEYETQLIPRVLPVGAKLFIADKEEESTFWGDIWDAIVEFFESLVDLVKDVVNWASTAYENLKSAVINFVANCIPLPGPLEVLRGPLKMALEGLVNAGLMALGLPPTIPNFDKLCEEGLNYLAEVALTEAGIPPNDLTEQLLADTAKAIGDEVGKSYDTKAPNPIDAPFLKNDPDVLEQPAYLDIEISNPYDKMSLPGSFTINVEWPYNEDITISNDIVAGDKQAGYLTHFLLGLKRGSTYYADYPLFKEVTYKIPALKSGDKCIARIYLEPYIGKPYPFAPQGDAVRDLDFNMMYFGYLGNVKFMVRTDPYNLPDPKEVAAAQGFMGEPNTIYTFSYDKLSSSDGFTQKANVPYSR